MKRFLSLLLTALMLVACASALAETTDFTESGLEIPPEVIADDAGEDAERGGFGALLNGFIARFAGFFATGAENLTEADGGAIEDSPGISMAENDSDEYRVFVCDTEGDPIAGVIVQLCDENTCSFQKTGADGVAIFRVDAPKVYEVHVGKVPEGYQGSDEIYKTLDTFCDVHISISKSE